METALVAQIGQLNKQLSYYKSLVAQHQEFFSEVYATLSADESRRLVGLQKKCRQLAARSNPNNNTNSDPAAMHPLHDDPYEQQGDGPSSSISAAALSEDAIKAASTEAANKIQQATVRLLDLWSDHLRSNVENLLQQPDAAFETFHETPTNESLEEFLGTYRNTAENIRELFSKNNTASSSRNGLGPKGNPFEMDDRLLNLYKVTIEESVASQLPLHASSTTTTTVGGGGRGETGEQSPATKSSKAQQHRHVTSPPQQPPTSKMRGSSSSNPPPASRPPLAPAEENSNFTTPAPTTTTGGGRKAGGEPPLVGRLNTRALQQPSPLHHHQQQHETPARVGTPRHSGMSNNSSQMMAMLGGGNPTTEASRPSTPQVPFEQLPRLQQLKHTLQQLEVQLSAVSAAGRDTGSEAKYYALSKKLQRVRAEVLKEQREQELLEKSNKEMVQQKQTRDERRRVFNR